MGKIFGQKVPLKMLFNANKRKALPQTILMHGPENVGKLETAINFVKSLHCTSKKLGFCDRCPSCQEIHFQQSPHLVALTNDDRLLNIQFYIHLLTNGLTKELNYIKYQLLGELNHLLARVNNGFLSPLTAEKKSYPKGVKLTSKQWEDAIGLAYKLIRDLKTVSIDKNYDVDPLIKTFQKIQNGLDRTIISKRGLDKFFKLTEVITDKIKVFILQNIQLINYQSASSLLKILEEPPPNYLFILITQSLSVVPFQIITPLRSRCFELTFNSLSPVSQKKIFNEKMGVSNDKSLTPSISENMYSFIHEKDNILIKYNPLLEIFNNKTYTVGRLFEYSQKNSLKLNRVISYYRDFLDQVMAGERKNTANLTIAKIQMMLSLLSSIEKLSFQTNISEKNLILRLLARITQII